MKKTDKPGVIVLGGHVQGYGIIRIFGEHNIPSIVIDNSGYNIAHHSKYCKAFYKIDYEGLIDFLMGLGRQGLYKGWLLIPTDDYYVRLLSQHKEALNQYFVVTVDGWTTINTFFNKKNAYPLAKAQGLPMPETVYPRSFEDLKEVCRGIPFPCILKPAIMLDFYRRFKKKVLVCHNRYELERNYRLASRVIDADQLLIQEIIPGSSEQQYSVGMFFERDKSYNCLVARRKRQHPVDFGNATTYAEAVDIPVLLEYARKVLSGAEFFGLCEVEFKFDQRDQQYKFLEVNPRTWKWHLLGQPAGIPFLLSLYEYFTEGNPIVAKNFKKAGWRDVVTDLPVILDMKRKGLYKRPDKSKMISAVLNLRDMRPFVFQLLFVPYNILYR